MSEYNQYSWNYLTYLHPNPCGSEYWHVFGRAGHGDKFNEQPRAISMGCREQRHEHHVSYCFTTVSTVCEIITQYLKQLQLLDIV